MECGSGRTAETCRAGVRVPMAGGKQRRGIEINVVLNQINALDCLSSGCQTNVLHIYPGEYKICQISYVSRHAPSPLPFLLASLLPKSTRALHCDFTIMAFPNDVNGYSSASNNIAKEEYVHNHLQGLHTDEAVNLSPPSALGTTYGILKGYIKFLVVTWYHVVTLTCS